MTIPRRGFLASLMAVVVAPQLFVGRMRRRSLLKPPSAIAWRIRLRRVDDSIVEGPTILLCERPSQLGKLYMVEPHPIEFADIFAGAPFECYEVEALEEWTIDGLQLPSGKVLRGPLLSDDLVYVDTGGSLHLDFDHRPVVEASWS